MSKLNILSAPAFDLLRCPACNSELVNSGNVIQCIDSGCASEFPIIDGTPVLIDSSRSIVSVDDYREPQDAKGYTKPRRLKAWLAKVTPSRSLNLRSEANYEELVLRLLRFKGRPRVLIIGGRITGEGAQCLTDYSEIDVLETDIQFGPNSRLICDGHVLPFIDQSFDAVVIQAVLEHVLEPATVVAEIHRVLNPEGLVYAETPFMQQVHASPYDFQRFTYLGHRRLFRYFQDLDSGPLVGPGTALLWSWETFLCSFTDKPKIKGILRRLARFSGFWAKYFDSMLLNKEGAWEGASVYYFLGRKADTPLSDSELVKQFRH